RVVCIEHAACGWVVDLDPPVRAVEGRGRDDRIEQHCQGVWTGVRRGRPRAGGAGSRQEREQEYERVEQTTSSAISVHRTTPAPATGGGVEIREIRHYFTPCSWIRDGEG